MNSYKELQVWQRGIDLVEVVYRVTLEFPEGEKYGLVSQMRRSAVSIVSNIAEGHGSKNDGDFARFLKIAYASSSELETQCIVANRLKFISDENFGTLTVSIDEIRKMLNSFISSVHRRSKS